MRRELFRILGDFETREGVVQVVADLSQFRRFLVSMHEARNRTSPELVILGHSGIEVFVRAGLSDAVDLDSCLIVAPTREESSRFGLAVQYCKRVRVIPQNWTVKWAKFWTQLVGLPHLSANNVSLDWGPPIHFVPSRAYVTTARKYGEVRDYDISELGKLISDVARRHGYNLPGSYDAPRMNKRA